MGFTKDKVYYQQNLAGGGTWGLYEEALETGFPGVTGLQDHLVGWWAVLPFKSSRKNCAAGTKSKSVLRRLRFRFYMKFQHLVDNHQVLRRCSRAFHRVARVSHRSLDGVSITVTDTLQVREADTGTHQLTDSAWDLEFWFQCLYEL